MRRFTRRFLPAVAMSLLSVPIVVVLSAKCVLEAFVGGIAALLVLPVETFSLVYQTDTLAEMIELRKRREREKN